MKWLTLTAALMICCVSSSADAGLFDWCHKDRCGEPSCCAPTPQCAPAPSCCAPAPVHCAPAPVQCAPAPSCCAPAPVHCAPAAPHCYAPAPVTCAPTCGESRGCCDDDGCFLTRLFRRNRNNCGDTGCCSRW